MQPKITIRFEDVPAQLLDVEGMFRTILQRTPIARMTSSGVVLRRPVGTATIVSFEMNVLPESLLALLEFLEIGTKETT